MSDIRTRVEQMEQDMAPYPGPPKYKRPGGPLNGFAGGDLFTFIMGVIFTLLVVSVRALFAASLLRAAGGWPLPDRRCCLAGRSASGCPS